MHGQNRLPASPGLKMAITTALTVARTAALKPAVTPSRTTTFRRRAGQWCLMGALLVPYAAFASAAAATGDVSTAKDGQERLRLVDLAISHCLARAFPDTPFAADAGRAAAAYVELGESDVDAYNEIGEGGLFYTGSVHQLAAQGLGVAAAFSAVFVVSFIFFFLISHHCCFSSSSSSPEHDSPKKTILSCITQPFHI